MTDCEWCEVKKFLASTFDIHFFGKDDCPFEKCVKENEDDNNKIEGLR